MSYGFFKDLSYDCDFVIADINHCCKYFSQIVTHHFAGSEVEESLVFQLYNYTDLQDSVVLDILLDYIT